MKKAKKILLLIIVTLLLFSINISGINAERGCCSHHGGQSYCDTNTGRWVCKDGTYSPSCTCSKEELKDNEELDPYDEKNDNSSGESEDSNGNLDVINTEQDIEKNIIPTILIMIIGYYIAEHLTKNVCINKKYKLVSIVLFIPYIITVYFFGWLLIPLLLGAYGYYFLEIISILLIYILFIYYT